MTSADDRAMEQLLAVAPAWSSVTTASRALGLDGQTLLHSGPPADPAHNLTTTILNSASVACVYEGWAGTLDDADAMIASGEVTFAPAQDRNVVTPMAAVVSPSTRLLEITDLNGNAAPTYAPINGGGTGGDPAPRYGRKSEEALDYLKFINDEVADAIAPAAWDPLPWFPIIDDALTKGDDGHLRHNEAHKTLAGLLCDRLGQEFAHSKVGEFVQKWPFFHLNYWMACSKLAMSAAADVPESAIITAFGGNGDTFGLQVSGLPGRWFTVPATPPLGNMREPHTLETVGGAMGDSAVAEGLGLGAMAQSYCPDMQALHADFNHDDIFELPAKLLMAVHPGFPKSGARVGLSARAVVETGTTPIVELGIMDKAGNDGGLGAGLYRPPIELFSEACAALDATM